MRTRIYMLMVVLLGLRVLELHAGLAPTWHRIAQIALIVAMYSVLLVWFHVERNSAEPAMERQPILTQLRTKRRH